MTVDEYQRELLEKLSQIERQIESHKATIALLEISRGQLRYQLNQHTRTVPRAAGE